MRQITPEYSLNRNTDAVTLIVSIPGASQDSIDLDYEDGVLELNANADGRVSDKLKLVHQEFYQGKYCRRFRLSDSLDTDNISASYEGGLLTIEIPKLESLRPKKIEVKEGLQ